MRLRYAVTALVLGVVASGCSLTASTPTLSPEAAFCDSLKDYAVAVVDFQALDDQNTIDEYKEAARGVEDAMQDVAAAAVVMGQSSVDELQTASDALVGTLTDLPQDTPVAQVRTEVESRARGGREGTPVPRRRALPPAGDGLSGVAPRPRHPDRVGGAWGTT